MTAAALDPDGLWTIGDALDWLDPPPPRRTLSRWLAGMEPAGRRRCPQGWPLARTYRPGPVMERHAEWARKYVR